MNMIVCVKRVPETTDVELSIDTSGQDIEKGELVFDLNEWDTYALEEAIQMKEKYGGKVTVVSMAREETNESLRKCLAMGADEALRLDDAAFEGSDGCTTAKVLAAALRRIPFDLILTGTQAEDDGYGQVGVALAAFLGIPHASVVNRIDFEDKKVRVHRELEEGLGEVLEIDPPALLTIQTGINEPRYVSIMGIRKVAKKEIQTWNASDLQLDPAVVGLSGADIRVEEIFFPPASEGAQMIGGTPEEVAGQVVSILKEKGGLA